MRHGARPKAAGKADCAAPGKPGGHGANWSYIGEKGVERWGAISADYAACAEGKQQSPIDISDGARLELDPIEFFYSPAPLRVIDNGHTVQINVDEGRYIVVLGKRYDLKQLHFHKPAEERIGGRSYDMVAHLVHKDVDGRLAVVAVLFEAGADNPFIRRLWPYLPLEPRAETHLPAVKIELDKLLPDNKAYLHLHGVADNAALHRGRAVDRDEKSGRHFPRTSGGILKTLSDECTAHPGHQRAFHQGIDVAAAERGIDAPAARMHAKLNASSNTQWAPESGW